jgi:hypothetical protein
VRHDNPDKLPASGGRRSDRDAGSDTSKPSGFVVEESVPSILLKR